MSDTTATTAKSGVSSFINEQLNRAPGTKPVTNEVKFTVVFQPDVKAKLDNLAHSLDVTKADLASRLIAIAIEDAVVNVKAAGRYQTAPAKKAAEPAAPAAPTAAPAGDGKTPIAVPSTKS